MNNELKHTLKDIRDIAQNHILSPANCFSTDNPNELLLIDGMLIGLFYPSKSEEREPLRFLRRILNSKLIYSNSLKSQSLQMRLILL